MQFPPQRTEAWIEQVRTVGEVGPYLITLYHVKWNEMQNWIVYLN